MKRILSIILAALLLFSGCRSKEEPAPTTAPTQATEPAQAVTQVTSATSAPTLETAITEVTAAPTLETVVTEVTTAPTLETAATTAATAPTWETIATTVPTQVPTATAAPTRETAATEFITAPIRGTAATVPTRETTETTAATVPAPMVTIPATAPQPTIVPTISKPTIIPTTEPTTMPTEPTPTEPIVTIAPTVAPTTIPTAAPTIAPTEATTQPTLPPIEVDPRFDSLAQEAVIKTALAFLNRGKYIQYDDTRFNSVEKVYRWETGMRNPEDYTSQHIGYTNCAAFTYDVYLSALDYNIEARTTADLTAKGSSQRKFAYYPTGRETEEEKASIEAEFRATLQVGDIIVVRYNGSKEGNGHAMLYVGDQVLENGKDIIHSTGSSYSYADFTEKEERNGSIQTMSTSSLFSKNSHLYTFSKLKSLCLIRPLATFKGSVPEDTQNRIRNMEGIVAEKLSSHTKGMTVNPGEIMRFTFSITNKNDYPVTLEIRDAVPANTIYIYGAQQVEGDSLSWQITVPAKQTTTVSYTVQVKDDAAYGDIVVSESTVGGVKTVCPKVYIQKSLTQDQQAKIQAAAESVTGATGMALADAIYQQALGKKTGLPTDFTTLHDSFFQPFPDPTYRLKGQGGILDLIPTGMFGGRKLIHRGIASDYMRLEYLRTRMVRTGDLMAGDIILAVGGPSGGENLYMYTGEDILNLNTGKTQPAQPLLNMLLGYDRFVVIRPSIGM